MVRNLLTNHGSPGKGDTSFPSPLLTAQVPPPAEGRCDSMQHGRDYAWHANPITTLVQLRIQRAKPTVPRALCCKNSYYIPRGILPNTKTERIWPSSTRKRALCGPSAALRQAWESGGESLVLIPTLPGAGLEPLVSPTAHSAERGDTPGNGIQPDR